jgi:hypothetical protein
MEKIKRLTELDNAENILKKRIETHRLDKFTPKEEFSIINESNQSKDKSRNYFEPLSSKGLPTVNVSELPSTSKC